MSLGRRGKRRGVRSARGALPAQLLDDLADLLAEVRTWGGVIEKSPGVFYVRRQPFLHFHLVAGAGAAPTSKGWRTG